MQKLWQKKLKLNYSENVIDIVQFGSSILEASNPNDIDIAVIFKEIPVKEQIKESHDIKKQIEEMTELPVHTEFFDLTRLFDKSNFAREGILFYGKSLLNKANFSEIFGIIPKLRISYVLKDLYKKDKVKFNYLLNGKGGNYGLLKKYGGKIIYPGVVETFPENENLFIEKMKKITSKLSIEKAFISSVEKV
jgi:predicted nucleotidyltransferase